MKKLDHSESPNSRLPCESVRKILLELAKNQYPQLIDSKGIEKQNVADRIIKLLRQIPHRPRTSIGIILDQYNSLSPGEFRTYQLQRIIEKHIEQLSNFHN